MKRGIIITVILVIALALSTIEAIYVERAFNELSRTFAALEDVIDANESDTSVDACIEKSRKAENVWKKHKSWFSIMLPHNALIELCVKMTRFVSTLECNDYTMAKIELHDILKTLPEYRDRYAVNIKNIL